MTTQALSTILKKLQDERPEPLSAWQVNEFFRKEFLKVSYSTELPVNNGPPFTWKLCRCDLLLAHLCSTSQNYLSAMEEAVAASGTSPLGGVLYCDEVVPGNLLRPDNKRRFWAFYLGFTEFGPERLCHGEHWLPLGILRSSVVAEVKGGLSQVVRQLLTGILLEPCKLAEVGICLKVPTPKLVRVEIRTIIGDESALKGMWASKGSAGIRPCFLCANVVSKHSGLAQSSGGLLVDIGEADPRKFEQLSDDDIWATFDRLAVEHSRASKKDFVLSERAAGQSTVYTVAFAYVFL